MGVRETLTFDHIKRGYTSTNMLKSGIAPAGPELTWAAGLPPGKWSFLK
jgi:glutathionyl-hydroquinone reductase